MILYACFGYRKWESIEGKNKKRIAKLDLSTLQKDVRPFLFDSNNQSVVLFDKIIEQTEFE